VLLEKNERPMIQHVWDQAMLCSFDDVFICTDSDEIANVCRSFGAKVILGGKYDSGSQRIAASIEGHPDLDDEAVVVNWQADEPEIRPSQVRGMVAALYECVHFKESVSCYTLSAPCEGMDEVESDSVVKVVTARDQTALYFSRSMIPWSGYDDLIDADPANWKKHIGIYAYEWRTLRILAEMKSSFCESRESLEQLRLLANGFPIGVYECDYAGVGIDTFDEYEKWLSR